MTTQQWVVVALVTGALTYSIRIAPFIIAGRKTVEERGLKFLIYSSMVIFAGIISKSLALTHGHFEPVEFIIKLAGLLLALLVYAYGKNITYSLFAGVFFAIVIKALVD